PRGPRPGLVPRPARTPLPQRGGRPDPARAPQAPRAWPAPRGTRPDASHDRDRRLVAQRPAPPRQRHVTMPPRGPARATPAVPPAPGYPVPAPRGTGMRGAVVGAVVGGVLALGVVVFLDRKSVV